MRQRELTLRSIPYFQLVVNKAIFVPAHDETPLGSNFAIATGRCARLSGLNVQIEGLADTRHEEAWED